MAKWSRENFPTIDPCFEAGGVPFYFLSELIKLLPKGNQPSRETILRLIRTKKLRARKFGREWIVTVSAWVEFLTESD